MSDEMGLKTRGRIDVTHTTLAVIFIGGPACVVLLDSPPVPDVDPLGRL